MRIIFLTNLFEPVGSNCLKALLDNNKDIVGVFIYNCKAGGTLKFIKGITISHVQLFLPLPQVLEKIPDVGMIILFLLIIYFLLRNFRRQHFFLFLWLESTILLFSATSLPQARYYYLSSIPAIYLLVDILKKEGRIFLFIIPAITMRLWSEEKKLGTIEILMTLPVKDYDVVIGKFLGSLSFLIIMIAVSAIVFIIVPILAPLIAPGFNSIEQGELINLIRIIDRKAANDKPITIAIIDG